MSLRTVLLAASAGTALAAIIATGAGAQATKVPGDGEAIVSSSHTNYYLENVKPLPPATHHLVFAAEPGGTGNGMLPFGTGGAGLVVLDADHNYRFVKRIAPDLAAGGLPGPEVSGIAASTVTNMVYVAYHGSLVAYDLATDKVAWTFKGEPQPVAAHFVIGDTSGCCERPWTLPDGKTLLVASSYNNWWYLIDGMTGAVEGKILTPKTTLSHNLAVTEDGKTAFLSALTDTVSVVDIPSRQVLRTITFSDAVRPLAINHDGSRVYVNTNDLLGFEIGDPKTGKVIKTVEAPAEMWKAKFADHANHFFGHGGPSHGIAVTPDEKEIWVVDNINYGLLVFDNEGNDNWTYDPAKSFKTTYSAGWISMTNDGRTAFLGSGDIVDVRTHKIIGLMKDENGQVLGTEKSLYLTFRDGRLVETNNQFAEGLSSAFEGKQASR